MLVELTNGLTDRGHKVTLLLPVDGIISYNVRSTILRSSTMTLHEEDFPSGDVIVSNYYTTVPIAEAASQQGKGIHVRLSLCYEPPFLPDNKNSFPSYHVTEHLIVLSHWQQELIRLNHGITGRIVPIGISDSFKNMNIRASLQEPLNITAILRKAEKGFAWHREQDYLIAQLEQVKQHCPQVNINFISPPEEFNTSHDLQAMKATGKYRFFTPADDKELCYHYNCADIFVSSSIFDTGSLPGLEAMRCGAALVCLYSGGNIEYALHKKNCLLSYRYENRLGTDVIHLIRNHDLRTKIAEAGERHSLKWTWKNSVKLFEQALIDLL